MKKPAARPALISSGSEESSGEEESSDEDNGTKPDKSTILSNIQNKKSLVEETSFEEISML